MTIFYRKYLGRNLKLNQKSLFWRLCPTRNRFQHFERQFGRFNCFGSICKRCWRKGKNSKKSKNSKLFSKIHKKIIFQKCNQKLKKNIFFFKIQYKNFRCISIKFEFNWVAKLLWSQSKAVKSSKNPVISLSNHWPMTRFVIIFLYFQYKMRGLSHLRKAWDTYDLSKWSSAHTLSF